MEETTRGGKGEGGGDTLEGRSPDVSCITPIFHHWPSTNFDASPASAAASPPVLHGNLTLSLFDSCSIEVSTLKETERERRIVSSRVVREELRREKKEEKRTQLGGDFRAIAVNPRVHYQQFSASLLVRYRSRRRSWCSSCEHRQTRSCTPEDEMESRKRKRVGSLRLCGGIQRHSAGGDVGLFQRQRRLLPSLFSSSPSGSYSNNYLIRTKVSSQILKTAYPLSPLCRRPAAAHFAATPHSAALLPLPTSSLSLAVVPSTLTLSFSLANVPSATLSCRSLPCDLFFPSADVAARWLSSPSASAEDSTSMHSGLRICHVSSWVRSDQFYKRLG